MKRGELNISVCLSWLETYEEISDWISTVSQGSNIIMTEEQRRTIRNN